MNKKINYWVAPNVFCLSEPQVVSKVCELFQTDVLELRSKKRNRNLVEGRALLSWYYVRKEKYPLAKAGLQINRDHASVIHCLKLVDSLLEYNKEFKLKFEQLFLTN